MKTVDDFAPTDTFDYPGKRNETSFVIAPNDEIVDFQSSGRQLLDEIEEYLSEHNLPGLDQRIPVLAYGANASPGRANKFQKYQIDETKISQDEMQTIPMIYGTMRGMDVVWHGTPGIKGNYFSEISPVDADTEIQVGIQLLTPEQLAVMHTTEGATYDFVDIGAVEISEDLTLPHVVGYVAQKSTIALDETGRPIATAGINRKNSPLAVRTSREMLSDTLGLEAVKTIIGEMTPEEFADSQEHIGASGRLARRKEIEQALISAGRLREITHPAALDTNKIWGRDHFWALPRVSGRPKVIGDDGKLSVPLIDTMENGLERLEPSADIIETLRHKYPNKTDEEIMRLADPRVQVRNFAQRTSSFPNIWEQLHEMGDE